MSLNMIAGPLVGALIGYCTNYIAVKMLFRPLKPVKIGNYTLPFTPGIIPKGKSRLAKAMGQAIGDTLLTKEDITNALLTDKVKKQVVEEIVKSIKNAPSIRELFRSFVEEEQYVAIEKTISESIENKILDAIEDVEISTIILNEGIKAIKEKLTGGFIGMFITDDLIMSVAEPMKEEIDKYIIENAQIGRAHV